MENLKKNIKIKESMLNDYKEIVNKVKSRFPDTTEYIDEEIVLIEAKYIHLDQVKYVFFLSYEIYFFLLQYLVQQPQNFLSV